MDVNNKNGRGAAMTQMAFALSAPPGWEQTTKLKVQGLSLRYEWTANCALDFIHIYTERKDFT